MPCMATGIFNTARTGANLKSRKRRGHNDTVERFAEALADTDSVTLASGRVGISTTHGHRLLARIRAGLGWQAK
jgi:hypothetical protein